MPNDPMPVEIDGKTFIIHPGDTLIFKADSRAFSREAVETLGRELYSMLGQRALIIYAPLDATHIGVVRDESSTKAGAGEEPAREDAGGGQAGEGADGDREIGAPRADLPAVGGDSAIPAGEVSK